MSDTPVPPAAANHAPSPEELVDAARAFFPQATALTPVPDSDHLLRVSAPSGEWCVRRWPQAITTARVEFVHALLTRLREAGSALVPAVAALPPSRQGTILVLGGFLYGAQSWLPGTPPPGPVVVAGSDGRHVNLPGALPPPAMTELIATVARIHAATETLARAPDVPRATLRDVAAAVGRAWQAHRERLRPVAPVTPLVQRWVRFGERALPAATTLLRAQPDIWQGTPVVGHHDLWPAHILLSQEGPEMRLTGIVDFADAAAGSPLLDLAQLITHFDGWRAETAEAVVGAYVAVRPLAPDERRVLPAVAALDLVGAAGWLLSLAYAPAQPLSARVTPLLRTAADALVASLETVTPLLEAGPPKKRWRR